MRQRKDAVKTKEMDTLMKARLSDFKKKASDQTKKLKKEEFIMENDVLAVATQLAAGEMEHQVLLMFRLATSL